MSSQNTSRCSTLIELMARGADASPAISAPGATPLTYAGLRKLVQETIATLNAAHEGLVFGRLDLKDPTEAARYVGRIGLRDADHDTLLTHARADILAWAANRLHGESWGTAER